ncbi:MAG: glycosyltransferase family 9 protein [Calditrichia bacterium]
MTTNPKKILIIRLSSIGDIILTFPLVDYLRQTYPDSQIDFLVKEQFNDVLLPINKKISNVILLNKKDKDKNISKIKFKLRKNNYNLILDLQNNVTSFLLTSGLTARINRYRKERFKRWLFIQFGLPYYSGLPVYQKYLQTTSPTLSVGRNFTITDWPAQPIVNQTAEKMSQRSGIDLFNPYLLIFPGARHGTKRWLKEYYISLINQLTNHFSIPILLAGDESESGLCQEIAESSIGNIRNLAGKLSLEELYILISQAELVLSNDSAPAHMAALFGKKQVVIFGNTVKEFGFVPNNINMRLLENTELSCRPCSHIGYEKCPKGHFKCMKEISPELVFEAISELLNHPIKGNVE